MDVVSDLSDPLSFLIGQITFLPLKPGVLAGIVVIIFLLAASAFISGSEVAFFSLSPKDKDEVKNRSGRRARQIVFLLSKPDQLLATILVANNFVNVAIVVLTTWMVSSSINFSMAPWMGFVLQTIGITFLILLIGEILPKVYASRYAINFAMFMAIPIAGLEVILRPVSFILIKSSSIVRRRIKETSGKISMAELSHALELTGEELHEEEQILKGIVKFGNIDVSEIMKPRVDMVATDIQTPFNEVIKIVIETGYSRIPVYTNDLDHIKGILFVKDLLPHFHKSVTFRWQSLIRPPYFVPENKKINDLLEEFQKNKNHLAIVVDEYGGTSGVVTLEDILEEIVGEISDESDEEEILYSKINDFSYLFNGKTSLHDLKKVLELPDDFFNKIKGDSETLAGLILEIKGELPELGDTIEYGGYKFTIRSVDDRRIKEVMVAISDHNKPE